jgi:TonB family protein
MYKFIGSQIRYPSDAQRANIQGKIFVKFVVQSDGEIGRIEILKGIGFGCEEEAVRVLAKMPKWKPGMQNGKPVAVYYTMPIAFRLEGGNDSEATEFPKGNSVPPPPPPKVSISGSGTTVRGVVNKDGSEPLIVVDGVVSEEGQMNNLNPADISSVNVIKDEAATPLYGQRGKNGVIVITTKEAGVLKANVYEMKEALYIVDGVEMTYDNYQKRYKKDASGSTTFIYKAGDAVEKFGQKGKNGVIVIKTKE